MKARFLLTFALAVGVLGLVGAAAGADTQPLTNPKHFFWVPGQNPDASGAANSVQNDLIYHGGNAGPGAIGVETKPTVYLVYWGTEWAQGFKTADKDGKLYSSKTLQTYVNTFVKGLAGSAYAGIQTQYCNGVAAGATSCVGGTGFVTSPKKVLKGVWTDPTPVPDDIIGLGLAENLVDDPIAAEAQRAAAHFHYDPNATYIVITPPRPIATGQPAYCGYHSQTTSVNGLGNPFRIQYSFIPWQNKDWVAVGCGQHKVNASSDAFGNGIFDSWSIVIGHEWAEAVTDPDNFASVQDGWNDNQTSENGDKCAWTDLRNITLAGHEFAVQPLWSNEAFDATGKGCVFSR